MRYLIFILLLLCKNDMSAQTGSISGSITSDGTGLAGATITLLDGADSAWIRTDIADDKGDFLLGGLSAGSYLLIANSLGCRAVTQRVAVKENEVCSITIDLKKDGTSLAEVAVTAKGPFVEMNLGKLTVNIEGTTTTGNTNVLDLMRRLPGVTVDMNGNITMQGKSGVLVLLDERQTYLTGDDLAEYLKTISADEVGQIELITQPGAKYDAAGNTGIINVKLKKNKKNGFTGSATGSYGLGVYFHREESVLLNYKAKKLNLSLSGSDMEAIGFADWRETLKYLDPQTGTVISQSYIHSTPKERFGNTAARLAADYEVTDKTTIGINARDTYHPNTDRGFLSTVNYDQASNVSSYDDVANADGFIRRNLAANGYLAEKFSKESSLDVNLDYLAYSKNEYQDLTTTTFDSQMNPLTPPPLQNSRQLLTIRVYSLKADYAYTFGNGMKLEAGIKSSWVTTNDSGSFRLMENNAWVNDTARSNHFLYQENINAAYAGITRSFGRKWEARIGLRAEQTIAAGLQYEHNSSFSRNYISPFPTAFLTYKKDTSNQFELNFGRRIERPGYALLNPFIYYNFQGSYVEGNPGLMPEYTYNAEMKHSYKNMFISTLSYSSTVSVISDMLEVDALTRTVYDINENIGSGKYITWSEVFNKELFKWWTLNVSGSLYYMQYTGPVNNINTTSDWTGLSLNINTQFDIGSGWKAEAYASYNTGERITPVETDDQILYMSLAAAKKAGKRLQLKFSAEDPFGVYQSGIHNKTDEFTTDARFRFASKLFSLSVAYNFGGKQQSASRESSLDEAKRIK